LHEVSSFGTVEEEEVVVVERCILVGWMVALLLLLSSGVSWVVVFQKCSLHMSLENVCLVNVFFLFFFVKNLSVCTSKHPVGVSGALFVSLHYTGGCFSVLQTDIVR